MPDSPVIAIAVDLTPDAEALSDAILRADGTPWRVPPDRELTPEDALGRVGGLLIASGPSREPGRDGGPRRALDSLYAGLLTAAVEKDMPVLGVGDGMLSLNLAFGGASRIEVPGHAPDVDGKSAYHRIYIAPGSRLAAIVGSGGFVRVNSRHQGGIKEAQKSPRLLASAYSLDDGVIEAVESTDHDWVIGIQFRPERRLETPPHFDRLFQGLVERAGPRRSIENP